MMSSVLSTERNKAIRDYFDGAALRRMLSDPMTYRDHLFAVMSFALWHELYVESRDVTPYLKVRL